MNDNTIKNTNLEGVTVTVSKGEKSDAVIEGELSSEIFESFRDKAVKKLNERVNIKGFRKGHVPESVLLEQMGEAVIMEEMAENALRKHYPLIVQAHDIDAIGSPGITITKLAKGNPLGFKIKTAVTPEFTLPDYATLAKKVDKEKEVVVSEKEIDETIMHFRKTRDEHMKPPVTDTEGGDDKKTDEDLTPLDDAYVQSLGDFKNVADFKEKIKENIKIEKKRKEREKRRMTIVDGIAKKTSMVLPDIIVQNELEKMWARFRSDIDRMKMEVADYLKHVNKTEEELKKGWNDDAEKQAKIQLILNEIAEKEKLTPKDDVVKQNVENLAENHKDVDKSHVETYVRQMITNQMVFEFLEGQ